MSDRSDPAGAPLLPGGFAEAEFTAVIRELFARELPDWGFEVVGPLKLAVTYEDGRTCRSQLGNLWAFYRRGDLSRSRLETFLASLRERSSLVSERADIADVVVLLKGEGFLAHAAAAVRDAPDPAAARLLSRPWVADLHQVYALDSPHSLRYLGHGDLLELGVDADILAARALANAATRVANPSWETMDGITMVTAGGAYETSLLLTPGPWDAIAAELGAGFVVTAPVRDLLLAAPAPGAARLAALTRSLYEEGPYSVSCTVLTRGPGGFTPRRDVAEVGQEPGTWARIKGWLRGF